MRKRILKLLYLSVALVTAFSFLPGQPAQATAEDFTTYTETDPLGYVTVTSSRVTYNMADDAAQESVTKTPANIAAGEDFELRYTYSKTSQVLNVGTAQIMVGVGDSANSTGLYGMYMYTFASNTNNMNFAESYNGTSYSSTARTITTGSVYYMLMKRVWPYCYLEAYLDSSYQTLLWSDNLTLHSSPSYTYQYPYFASIAAPGSTSMVGYIENMNRTDTTSGLLACSTGNASYTGHSGGNTQMWQLQGTVDNMSGLTFVSAKMLIGLSPGNWIGNLGLDSSVGTKAVTVAPYSFSCVATGLLPNTTYYYETYCWSYIDLYTVVQAYGGVQSFATSANTTADIIVPWVTTGSAVWNAATSNVTFSGTVQVSTLPIKEWGISWGYGQSLTTNVSAPGNFGSGGQFSFTVATGPGLTLVYQAWATDTANNTGYGAILQALTPPGGGAVVSRISSAVSGTSVVLVGRLDTIGADTITCEGFCVNTVNTTVGGKQYWNITGGFSVGQFTYQFDDLDPTTTYYWWAGVWSPGSAFANVPAWSAGLATFVTGTDNPLITHLAPSVKTLAVLAASITQTSFVARVEVLNTGGANLSEVGFNYGTTGTAYSSTIPFSGNYSVGIFSFQLTGFVAGSRVFFEAYGTNPYGTTDGGQQGVVLATVTLPGSPAPGSTGGFSGYIHNLLVRWGMDTTMGHYGFIGIVMLVVAVVFMFYILFTKERWLKLLAGIILSVIELVIIAGAIFSGFLGLVAIIVTVVVAVGIILIFGGVMLTHGRVAQ